jgi:hypothetical protein
MCEKHLGRFVFRKEPYTQSRAVSLLRPFEGLNSPAEAVKQTFAAGKPGVPSIDPKQKPVHHENRRQTH